ncbi:class I SAM-dependent methyltransferase [Candidatus Woesearchaeota archaeon]|nr:class I SAM-dependent methyltransferase [Candidatus Woesearchaeota archaeon]
MTLMYATTTGDTFTLDALLDEFKDFSPDIERSEAFCSTTPLSFQEGYYESRRLFQPAAQGIIHGVFNSLDLPDNAVIAEFGCGAHGPFYLLFAPKKLRKGWSQFDINPDYVRQNNMAALRRLRRANAHVASMFKMPLDSEGVDVVVGMSAWDTDPYPELAFNEVARVLKSGGYFVHFQDLLPADYIVLRAEALERERRGLPISFSCEHRVEHHAQDGLLKTSKNLTKLDSIRHGHPVTTIRYLTDHLAQISESHNFSIEIDESRTYTHEESIWRINRRTGLQNSMRYRTSTSEVVIEQDSSVPRGKRRIEYEMDVVVARKP